MGTLMVRCRHTGQDFSSGIETDRLSFELMPVFNATIRCPLCGIDHSWSKIDAWVREEPGQPDDDAGSGRDVLDGGSCDDRGVTVPSDQGAQ